jgi:site-specific recombinase XerD
MPEPPYKLAKFVASQTDRSYIVFYVWDVDQNKLVRKRDYDCNKIENKFERKRFIEKRIGEINKLLIAGYHVNRKKSDEKQSAQASNFRKDYDIDQALRTALLFVKGSKRKQTYDSYSSVKKLFIEFCHLQGWDKWPAKTFEKKDIIGFLDYSQGKEDGVGNVTRNKYLGFLRAMFGMLVERGIMEKNPAAGIKQEPEDVGKNIAYSQSQAAQLKPAILESNKRLWYFCMFIYYGFIRPAELARLKVSMIDLDEKTITLPANITKNHRIRYVRISPGFEKIIRLMNLHRYNKTNFVFGYNLETDKKPLQKNYASARHKTFVDQLDFGTDYTLYSWKHTGVVEHFKAGIDIKSLQQQLGHSSLTQTDIYLKSLGLIATASAFDKSPEI